jgi:hypothetical protein
MQNMESTAELKFYGRSPQSEFGDQHGVPIGALVKSALRRRTLVDGNVSTIYIRVLTDAPAV